MSDIKKIPEMTDDQLAARVSMSNLFIEAAYMEAAERADKAAEAANDPAEQSRLQAIAIRFKKLYHQHKALHCDVSVLANEAMALPMPRSGER